MVADRVDAELYEPVRNGRYGAKFKVETGGLFEDLPRSGNTAVIAIHGTMKIL